MSLHTCFPHGDPICLHVITKFSFNCAISPHQWHHSLANVQYPIGSAPYIFVQSYAIFFRWRNFSTPIASFVCIANTQYRIIAQTGRRHPICLHVITKFPFNYAMVGLTRPSFCHMTLSTKTVGYFAHNFLNSCSSQWSRKVIQFLRAWTVVVLLPRTNVVIPRTS